MGKTNSVTEKYRKVLQLTFDLENDKELFCKTLSDLGHPVKPQDVQRWPAPVTMCMRLAAAHVYDRDQYTTYFAILFLQLEISGLVQNFQKREELGITWTPPTYAGADPTKLSDSLEEVLSRSKVIDILKCIDVELGVSGVTT